MEVSLLAGIAIVLLIAASPLFAKTYKKKVAHKGRDVTPKEAHNQQDPKHTLSRQKLTCKSGKVFFGQSKM